jgi:hypothetical protein
MWGKGIYFAVNANYSCPNYSYSCGSGQYEVFFANVVIGKDKEMPSTSSLLCPPDGYDSVKGHTNGSDVYMVYKNVKTYPGLLIRY